MNGRMSKLYKKLICIFIIGFLAIFIYKFIEGSYSIEDISKDDTLELAKKSGCVIFYNGDISYGREIWDSFIAKVESEKNAKVRLVDYWSSDDNSDLNSNYELFKNDNPQINVRDIEYDGNSFRIKISVNDLTSEFNFKYLMRYEGTHENSDDSYVKYVLTNDNTVTWADIWNGILSSNSENQIAHYEIYMEER